MQAQSLLPGFKHLHDAAAAARQAQALRDQAVQANKSASELPTPFLAAQGPLNEQAQRLLADAAAADGMAADLDAKASDLHSKLRRTRVSMGWRCGSPHLLTCLHLPVAACYSKCFCYIVHFYKLAGVLERSCKHEGAGAAFALQVAWLGAAHQKRVC